MLDNVENQLDDTLNSDDSNNESGIDNLQDPIIEEQPSENSDVQSDIEDNEQILPDEFKDENGKFNPQAVLKFTNERDELLKQNEELTQKSKILEDLQNERETYARQMGFKDFASLSQKQSELSSSIELAQFEAAQYAQYLHKTQDPDDVRSLLIQYSQSPNPYLLNEIERNFDTSVIKEVAQNTEKKRFEIKNETDKKEYENYRDEARVFVTQAIEKHKEMFEDSAFKELFSECIKFAGNRFNSDELVRMTKAIGNNAVARHIADEKAKKENNKVKENLINNSPNGKTGVDSGNSPVNIDELSEAQIQELVMKNI